MKGKRDRALLSMLVGCGLRRKEATTLFQLKTFSCMTLAG
jgi:hypothetical protein